MRTTTDEPFGPETTPLLIKRLILITVISSFFCSLAEVYINTVFDVPGPMTFLALNTPLFFKGYIFQLMTYPLTFGEVGQGVSFFYMITLMLNLYILWVLGSHIIERMGTRSFVKLYLFSTILAGLTGVFIAALLNTQTIFSSCIPQVLAILVAWTMLNSEGKLYLIPPFGIKAKWLTIGVLSIALLPSLFSFDLPFLGFYCAGVLAGWLFALFSWHLISPWSSLKEIENKVIVLIARVKLFFKRKKSSKIIDIRSLQEEEDAFMDECLEKISKYGESALTPLERKRMQKVSRRKK